MKLVSSFIKGNICIGAQVVREGKDYVGNLKMVDPALPGDMIEFLTGGDNMMARARDALAGLQPQHLIPADQAKLTAPIPRPGKIICVGLNYRDHAEEGGRSIPDYPDIFSKFTNTVIGHLDPIVIPRATSRVDYEVELAVVIGEKGRYIAEADASEHIAGYMVFNDVSARDYQRRVSQWTTGKVFDTFAPMGPALVTKDEVPDPGNLEIYLTLNGQEMQHSNTRNLIFSVPFLIHYLSEVMTLEPGDVISTGTPAGVGGFRNPPVYLKPGDEVVLTVEGVGTLINTVVAEAD